MHYVKASVTKVLRMMAAGNQNGYNQVMHLQSLAPSLERAVKVCMSQLQALRASGTADKQSSTYSAEERALKLSLSSLITQLQAVRQAGQARCHALLQAVLPGALQMLNTRNVLPLSQASRAVRACVSAGGEGQFFLLPHLDAVPESPGEWEHFLTERVALGAVRWVCLPAAPTALLLSQHAGSLSTVESLRLPPDCSDFSALPRLPSLQRLDINASGITDSRTLERLAASLLGLSRPLGLLRIGALLPELAVSFLNAIMSGGIAHRLTFQQCAMPDVAITRVCSALMQGVPLFAVHFEECGLSEHSEQHLLATLEQCDGSCQVTINGGMAQQCPNDETAKAMDSQEAEIAKNALGTSIPADTSIAAASAAEAESSEDDATSAKAVGPAFESHASVSAAMESMSMQEMLAMALLRLQEEAQYPNQCLVPPAVAQCSSGSGSTSAGRSAGRSRFGFALDDSQ